MVELWLLDSNFKKISVITKFRSLQWTERHFGVGEYEVHFPLAFTDALLAARYIFRSDKDSAGVINYYKLDDTEIMLKGSFLEDMLNDRVVESASDADTIYTGTAEGIAVRIISDICINNAARKIPKLAIGATTGLGTALTVQANGQTVYDAISTNLINQDLWFRLRYDIYADKLYVDFYRGADRTLAAPGQKRDMVVFSKNFHNVANESFEFNKDDKNFAYVEGSYTDGSRLIYEVDLTAGAPRNELYVTATDIDAAALDYSSLVKDYGARKLSEYNDNKVVSFDVTPGCTMEFALGDKCTYANDDLGLRFDSRVTEITEVIEANSSRKIKLGKELLTLPEKIKRGV